jgi:hypothetical protein
MPHSYTWFHIHWALHSTREHAQSKEEALCLFYLLPYSQTFEKMHFNCHFFTEAFLDHPQNLVSIKFFLTFSLQKLSLSSVQDSENCINMMNIE